MKFLLQTTTFFTLLLLTAPLAKAETEMSTNTLTVGETVTITGDNFGYDKTGRSQICFKEDDACLTYGISNSITTWTDSKIEFTVPYFGNKVYPSGRIYIYAGQEAEVCLIYSCYTTTQQVKVTDVPYTFEPLLYGFFNEDGENQNSFFPGDKVTIRGYYFGDRGALRIRTTKNKFIEEDSWSDAEIEITIPKDFSEKELSLVLSRGYDSEELPIDIPVLGNIKGANDTLAVIQRYFKNHFIEELWSAITEKEEIVVAVIDSGVNFNHPSGDLTSKRWENKDEIAGNGIDDDQNGYIDDKYGWDFAYNTNVGDYSIGGHGTTVASIIAAQKNDNAGIAGISEKTKIMGLNVFTNQSASLEHVTKAIKYAVNNGARVINLSLGSNSIAAGYSELYNDAINYAWERGVIVVIAAGNGDQFGNPINTNLFKTSPVCNDQDNYKKIIGVGSLTGDAQYLSSFSNTGSCVDIYAQGENIIDITPEGYNEEDFLTQGTSFSAPIVTGVVSYILSARPTMSNEAIYDLITNSSENGILNAKNIATNIKKYKSKEDIGNKWTELYKKTIQKTSFTDIKDASYPAAIEYLKENKIVAGYSDGSYKPFNRISRAEFTKIIMETLYDDLTGGNCFKDVKSEWFGPYICKAKELGIINGYSDNSFKPNNEITIAEALKITLKSFSINTTTPTSDKPWYSEIINYAKTNNLYLKEFVNENQSLTRQEMAEIIYRILANR